MVQEDGLLHERHDGAGIGDGGAGLLRPADQLILQLAGQPLRLAPGELERGVLGAVTVAPPGQVVTAQACRSSTSAPPGAAGAGPAPAGPPRATCRARRGTRSSTRPGTARSRQQGPDEVEPLGLVRELRGGYLDPALNLLRHGPVSSTPHQPGDLRPYSTTTNHTRTSMPSAQGMARGGHRSLAWPPGLTHHGVDHEHQRRPYPRDRPSPRRRESDPPCAYACSASQTTRTCSLLKSASSAFSSCCGHAAEM